MSRILAFCWFFASLFFSGTLLAQPEKRLKFNILSRDLFNEAGKEVDAAILQQEIESLGHSARLFDYLQADVIPMADVNIFLAQCQPTLFSRALCNWFIPNPDFCVATKEEIARFDLVLCKTKETLSIFRRLTQKVLFIGFTSLDCYREEVPKDFAKYLHLAGKSKMKGSEELLRVWKRHPEFPLLHLIKRDEKRNAALPNLCLFSERVPREELFYLQNHCGVHLCPSKTEGFGHYIMEAMSAQAVVIATDAPPMNEFVLDARCQVPYKAKGLHHYATTYIVSEKELARKIQELQSLSEEELRAIGAANRQLYLKKTAQFKANFRRLIKKTENFFVDHKKQM